jgi:hypothetical protein
MAKVMLREIAHSRAGDKSNISNISVICYESRHYELVKSQVTVQKVKEYFAGLCFGNVSRYEVDTMCALNFVLEETLDGGNTRSLRVDGYGKSLSGYMLSFPIEVPEGKL